MKIVRQPPGSSLCVAACMAMVLDSSINNVLAIAHVRVCDDHVYLPMKEVARLLMQHGYLYGGPIAFKEPQVVDAPFVCPVEFGEHHAALVSVKSKVFEGSMHLVVWDHERKMILDPQHDEPQPLSNYEVIEWGQITPLAEI